MRHVPRRIRQTRARLVRRLATLLLGRRQDAATLSPWTAFLVLGASVMIVYLLGAPSSSRLSERSSAAPLTLTQTPPLASTQGQLSALVGSAIWGTGVQRSQTVYDAKRNTATVTITLGGTVPQSAAQTSTAQELAKGFCLMAEQAIWNSDARLSEVTVVVQGPLQSEYGDVGTDVYAVAVVKASSGHSIQWSQLTPDSAWGAYDSVFLRESFVAVV